MRRSLFASSFVFALASLVGAVGCGGEGETTPVVDEPEVGAPDTSVTPDTRPPLIDSHVDDTATPDGASPDSTTPDTTSPDTTSPDTTSPDSTSPDTAKPDTGLTDTAVADTAMVDTAMVDTAVTDTFVADTFVADTFVADTFVADTFVADTFIPDTFVPDAGAACNTVTQIGDIVTITRVASAPPTLTGGGAIPSGTYVMTGLTLYTGPGGATGTVGTARQTFTLTSPAADTYLGNSVSTDVTPTTSTQRSTTTTTVSGINFTQTWLCRDPLPLIGPLSGTYEISGTTLKLLYTAQNALYTLERKP